MWNVLGFCCFFFPILKSDFSQVKQKKVAY